MQTLKTAGVVVLLLVVFYGVYEMLNRPPAQPPEELAAIEDMPFTPPDIDIGMSSPGLGGPSQLKEIPSYQAKGDMESPVPPPPTYGGPDRDSSYTTPPPDPDAGQHLTVEPPPTSSFPGDPSAPTTADTTGSQMQHNPYLEGDSAPTTDRSKSGTPIGVRAYETARKLADRRIEDGQYHDALKILSIFYKSQDLTAEEQKELLDLLDPLAGEVIYSTAHLVQSPHKVRRNETLMDIGEQYGVPWELLQKVNQIENPNVLLPGSEIKVVSGPFRAEVDLETQELTVFLGSLYAGRFPISVGADPRPMEGEFQVRNKMRDRAYFSAQGRKIPAESAANPFGGIWLDLGGEQSIHGSPTDGPAQDRGCISLSPRDADDVYSILSKGSSVRIRR